MRILSKPVLVCSWLWCNFLYFFSLLGQGRSSFFLMKGLLGLTLKGNSNSQILRSNWKIIRSFLNHFNWKNIMQLIAKGYMSFFKNIYKSARKSRFSGNISVQHRMKYINIGWLNLVLNYEIKLMTIFVKSVGYMFR